MLLTTKLYSPPVRQNLVVRARLLDDLDQGYSQGHRLFLISAPAGYGKTTLLASWIQRLEQLPEPQRPTVCWFSIDPEENDPASFFTYLVAALQSADPSIGQSILDYLAADSTPEALPGLVNLLINDLARYRRRILLCLDDYHAIHAVAIHQAVAHLVERGPEGFALVIATRDDPLLPLSRLRARGWISEIRARDLRFTTPEAELFFQSTFHLTLTGAEVDQLEARTEGWAAGLQLAGFSLHESADRPDFLQRFSGSDRQVMDYLVDEVLSHQSEEIQSFLLKTAVMDRFCAEACETVIGGQWSVVSQNSSSLPTDHRPLTTDHSSDRCQQTLDILDRSNLFLVPLDNERKWYRYHHLFADLLRHHLRRRFTAPEVAGLYTRASEWFEQQGMLDEAVQYATQIIRLTGSGEQLVGIIERHGTGLLYRAQITTLSAWLDLLPDPTLRANPGLCLLCAWAAMLSRTSPDLRLAEEYLILAEQAAAAHPGLLDGLGYPVACRAAVTRATLSRVKGDPPEAVVSFSKQALDLLPVDDYANRGSLLQNLGMAYLALNDIPSGWQALQQCWQETRATGNHYISILAVHALARCLRVLGRIEEMDRLLAEGIREAQAIQAKSGRAQPLLGFLYVGRSWYLLEQDQFEEADALLQQGMELCGLTREYYTLAEGYTLRARLLSAAGDLPGALSLLNEMERNWPETTGSSAALKIALLDSQSANQRFTEIERCADHLPSHLEEDFRPAFMAPGLWKYQAQLGLARLQIARRRRSAQVDLQPVLLFLDRQIEILTRLDWRRPLCELLLLKALALHSLGSPQSAQGPLAQAMEIAESAGFYRLFLEEGAPLAKLLQACDLPESPLARRLSTALGLEHRSGKPTAHPYQPPKSQSLVEPLSEREHEVLGLLAEGLSNLEICQRLYISLPTVKTHLRNIFGKLEVDNRRQAVLRAREMGLM